MPWLTPPLPLPFLDHRLGWGRTRPLITFSGYPPLTMIEGSPTLTTLWATPRLPCPALFPNRLSFLLVVANKLLIGWFMGTSPRLISR